MKTTRLRLAPHALKAEGQACEIILGDELLGVIYPAADGVKLITKHAVMFKHHVGPDGIDTFHISIRAKSSAPSVP